jgi:hypothetical protein
MFAAADRLPRSNPSLRCRGRLNSSHRGGRHGRTPFALPQTFTAHFIIDSRPKDTAARDELTRNRGPNSMEKASNLVETAANIAFANNIHCSSRARSGPGNTGPIALQPVSVSAALASNREHKLSYGHMESEGDLP